MRLSILDHALNFIVRQTTRCFDHNRLLLTGRLVFGRHMQNAVGIDIKGHFDLRHAPRRWRNFAQVEAAERFIGLRLLAFALQHVHRDRGLIVVGGREHLIRLGRNRGVFLDQFGHYAAQGFDAERQRRYIQQQHVFDIAPQHAGLNGRTHRHRFVWINILARLATKEFFDYILHFRHACLATDQDHIVNLGRFKAGIFQSHPRRLDRALDQILHQGFELGACDFNVEVLRSCRIGRDIGQVNVGLLTRRQLNFGFFGRFFQTLQGERVFV